MCARQEEILEINDLIVYLKRLEKEEKIKPKEVRRKRHIHQKQQILKLSKILSIICTSQEKGWWVKGWWDLSVGKSLEIMKQLSSWKSCVLQGKIWDPRSEGIQYFLNSRTWQVLCWALFTCDSLYPPLRPTVFLLCQWGRCGINSFQNLCLEIPHIQIVFPLMLILYLPTHTHT